MTLNIAPQSSGGPVHSLIIQGIYQFFLLSPDLVS